MNCYWSGTVAGFVGLCQRPDELVALLREKHRSQFPDSDPEKEKGQEDAWRRSLPTLARTLASAGLFQAYIALEYSPPWTGLVADAILYGRSEKGQPTAAVVELKSWTRIARSDNGHFPFAVAGLPTPQKHPSTQALTYRDYLSLCHEQASRVRFEAAVFMHELPAAASATGAWGLLRDPHYEEPLKQAPLFGKDDPWFVRWLKRHLGREDPKLGDQFHALLTGGYRPPVTFFSKAHSLFVEMLLTEEATGLVGASAWRLSTAQQQVVDRVMAAVRNRERRAFVVTGEPGSGKTVVALNLVKEAYLARLSGVYATGNDGLLKVATHAMGIWGHAFLKSVRSLLKDGRESRARLLVVDEAQRLWGEKSEADRLLALGQVVVYFLDDDQILQISETGTSAEVRARVEKAGVPCESLHLPDQFRCGGGPAYTQRVDRTLGRVLPVGDLPQWDRGTYPVVICASSEEMRERLREWAGPGDRYGLVAALSRSAYAVAGKPIWVKQEAELQSYYNQRKSTELRHTVSIYTVQGLEMDYVGLIWGGDMVWRSGRWLPVSAEVDEEKLRREDGDTMLRLLKNRYRVLLTRSLKGLAIYCPDEETRAHLIAMLG